MNEIECRGKGVEIGGWVYGWLIRMGDRYFIAETGKRSGASPVMEEYLISVGAFKVHPDTIGRRTGLKDKNGNKDVYSGDKFKIGNREFVVKWDDYKCCFHLQDMSENSAKIWSIRWVCDKTAIRSGTIHDNDPERINGDER